MAESVRAVKTSVKVGSATGDGFMGSDGSYRVSQTKVAGAAGLSRRNASDFLRSNALKSLLGKGYTGTVFEREEIEIEFKPSSRGQSWFLSVPPKIASAYWLRQVRRGNKAASALCTAPIAESLERRFDQALGVTRTRERNEILNQRVQPLERSIRETFRADDEACYEPDRAGNGTDPWRIPGGEG